MRGGAGPLIGRVAGGLATVLLIAVIVIGHPKWLFGHHVTVGRLSVYSDAPVDQAGAQRVLRDVEARLATSPLDDHKPHAVFVCNSAWRRKLYFNVAGGAAGVNYYPLTNDIFLRHADIAAGVLFGASGKPAAAPRTMAYYAAHEITHSFTAEAIGPLRLWNKALPQWLREGYADYVGMGGRVDIDAMYQAYRAHDPAFDWRRSGQYAKFRLLAAYAIEREHRSIEELLDRPPGEVEMEARMNRALGGAAP